MQKINDHELLSIQGGAKAATIGIIIVGVVSFLIGVLEGLRKPLTCK